MYISNPFNGAFGLDLGDLSIKLVELGISKKTKDKTIYKINKLTSIPLPNGYIVNGTIEQPEMVRKKIMQLLGKDGEGQKIESPYVVADLPEPQTFLTTLTMDLPKEKITREDVEFQLKQNLPIDLNEAYFDYQITANPDNSSCRLLVGAVPKNIANSYTYLLESAGLTPIALEVETLSITRSIFNNFPQNPGLILDLGATRSAVIVYDNQGVCFSNSLNFSGELLNTALVQNLKLEYNRANELRVKTGLVFNPAFPDYLKIIEPIFLQLMEDIKKNILYYEEHFNNQEKISLITVCGGVSKTINLKEYINKELNIKVEEANIWENIDKNGFEKETDSSGPALASAIGLSMRAAANLYQNND
jgi:type IV pilus assembly protein PilM